MPKEHGMSIPAWDSLTDHEVAVQIFGGLDDLGRVRLDAFWRSAHGPGTPTWTNPFVGVRAQVFHTNLAEFVRREARNGNKVTALDEHTQTLLDSLNEG